MLAWKLCDFKEIRTSIANEPYIFVKFPRGRGGVGVSGPPVPHLDPYMFKKVQIMTGAFRFHTPCMIKKVETPKFEPGHVMIHVPGISDNVSCI